MEFAGDYPPASWDLSMCAASIICIFAIICQRIITKLNKNYMNKVKHLISVASGNNIANAITILLPPSTNNYTFSSLKAQYEQGFNIQHLQKALLFIIGLTFLYILDLWYENNGKKLITIDIPMEEAPDKQKESQTCITIPQSVQVSSDTSSVRTSSSDIPTKSTSITSVEEITIDLDTALPSVSMHLKTDIIREPNTLKVDKTSRDTSIQIQNSPTDVIAEISPEVTTGSISLPVNLEPRLAKPKKKKGKVLENDYLNLRHSSIPLMLTLTNIEGCAINGVILGSAFAKGKWAGSITTFIMFCLGITREFSETAVVLNCGATFRNILISSLINCVIFLVGTTIGIKTHIADYVLVWSLPFASGLMMYIGFVKLLPLVIELNKHENTVTSKVVSIAGFLFGSCSSIVVSYTGDKIAAQLFL